ncbi:hypothetical protein ACMHYJ_05365 [Castellaniella hirudinis]|uniref:hypothetical protein n=1 Tax=Castellaniella hirudinis TaxID=1144617 RepID=UPI0039C10557
MADKRRGDPGPLAGLDGAAEIGMAETMLKARLTPLQLMVLACRYAPSKLRCECRADCCSGWRTNPTWRTAIADVAGEAVYHALPAREHVDQRYVAAVLLREYGAQKIALTDVGASLGMPLGTCTNRKRKILGWLLRPKALPEVKREDGTISQPAQAQGIEVSAFALAEEVLRGGGFIE